MPITRSAAALILVGLVTSLVVPRGDRPRDRDRSRDWPVYTEDQAAAWLELHRRRDDHVVRRLEALRRDTADYRALAEALAPIDDDVADALDDIADAVDELAEATEELIDTLRDD